MFTVIVFFNEARTDYLCSDLYPTPKQAYDHITNDLKKLYGDRAKYEVANIIDSPTRKPMN